LIYGTLVGVAEDEDDRVAPQEELGDVPLLVLLFGEKKKKGLGVLVFWGGGLR
jgi:hypothetical protein